MNDNHKRISELMKELDEAVKALDMALYDMAKNLINFVNVVYKNGIEKCSQEKSLTK